MAKGRENAPKLHPRCQLSGARTTSTLSRATNGTAAADTAELSLALPPIIVVVFILVRPAAAVALCCCGCLAAAALASSSRDSLTLTLVTLVRSRSDLDLCGCCRFRCAFEVAITKFEVEPPPRAWLI